MPLDRVAFGTKVTPVAIEKFKAVEGVPDIVAVLSIQEGHFFAAKTHYVDKLNAFYCFGGNCCRRHRFPTIRYIAPIVRYTIHDMNSLAHGLPVSMQFLALGKESYEEFMTKHKLRGITKHDLYVTCTDKQYQRLSFEFMDGPPQWQRDDKMKQVVLKEFQRYLRLIEMSVARELTPEQYEQEYAKLAAGPAIPPPVPGMGMPAGPGLPPGAGQVMLPDASYVPDQVLNLNDLMGGEIKPEDGGFVDLPQFSDAPTAESVEDALASVGDLDTVVSQAG